MTFFIRGSVGKITTLISLASALMPLVGCNNWGKRQATQEPTVSITLLNSGPVPVTPGSLVPLEATVYDPSKQGVVWTFAPPTFGTLNTPTFTAATGVATVTYTAPTDFTTTTTVTITATSITNPNIASSIQIPVSPVTVSLADNNSLALGTRTLNQGEQLMMQTNLVGDTHSRGVTWSLSPATGAGSFAFSQTTNATYAAPAVVFAPTTVTITATSIASPASTATVAITVLPSGGGPNAVLATVDGGPVPGQLHQNGAFTSVTLCNPGSLTSCQTVGGILIDTGSYGLRILQSEMPMLNLLKSVNATGLILENCLTRVGGSYLWGPVYAADVYIGGESNLSLQVQVISSSNNLVPDGCSNGGRTNENTPELLGANGILGIGPEPTDCTLAGVNLCDGSKQPTSPNLYYACPSAGCATTDLPIIVAAKQQVANPIPAMNNVGGNSDTNGSVLQLPPVSSPGASASGLLIFGIGTETNNQLGSATVFTLDSNDHFTTTYHGQSLTSSVINSGADALYFPDSLPVCSTNPKFFCPPSLTTLSAVNQGATQGQSTVTFSVDNADNLFSNYPGDAVFNALAGPEGTFSSCSGGGPSCTFVWGLPFFYGRSVFTAIDGQPVTGAPNGPWWAY